ncbi:MAG: hypothetical protein OER96_02060 [Gammaproteobacteria bacterium]|nr:hypothetical protein [Gammaproteobacteria bacterium]
MFESRQARVELGRIIDDAQKEYEKIYSPINVYFFPSGLWFENVAKGTRSIHNAKEKLKIINVVVEFLSE